MWRRVVGKMLSAAFRVDQIIHERRDRIPWRILRDQPDSSRCGIAPGSPPSGDPASRSLRERPSVRAPCPAWGHTDPAPRSSRGVVLGAAIERCIDHAPCVGSIAMHACTDHRCRDRGTGACARTRSRAIAIRRRRTRSRSAWSRCATPRRAVPRSGRRPSANARAGACLECDPASLPRSRWCHTVATARSLVSGRRGSTRGPPRAGDVIVEASRGGPCCLYQGGFCDPY
jgi:hypothetical protein